MTLKEDEDMRSVTKHNYSISKNNWKNGCDVGECGNIQCRCNKQVLCEAFNSINSDGVWQMLLSSGAYTAALCS